MLVNANIIVDYLVMYESLLRKPPQATNIRTEVDFNSNETLPNSVR